MTNIPETVQALLVERFGKDSLIALATVTDGQAHVRTVDAYYEDGSFYIVTHALSGKMQQIAKNPQVAVCGEWFTGHGVGENLGAFGKAENKAIAETLARVYASWLSNGHTDPSEETTVILRIRLTDGVVMAHGVRHEFAL